MNKLVARSIVGISLFVSSFVAVPAQASPVIDAANPIRIQQKIARSSNQYVFQTNSHVNTGVSVNPGDTIKIKASGRIRFGFFAGSGGPKGILFNPDYNYFIDMFHGQLMGRIRGFGMADLDGWFAVGEGREIIARGAGVLEFAVNDNKPGDNAGSFRIEVTIDSAK
jgi:hypothetical protein